LSITQAQHSGENRDDKKMLSSTLKENMASVSKA